MTDAVVTAGLTKRYQSWRSGRGARAAVANLDLRVPSGGITGLLGPNGAGKSTTVKLLLGLARPTSGHATVLGRDSQRESLAIRHDIAFVPEERAILAWMRAGQLIAGVAAHSRRWDAACAARLTQRWGVDPRMRLRELSLGTRSRLALLIALARRSPLLVLDEPTSGLDPAAVEDVLAELTMAAADGATILLVTHRLEEVERICDRVVVMNDGTAVLQEDLDELRASWRVIDVACHPNPERMREWSEVADVTNVTADGEHVRLLVRSAPDAVVERVRMMGAEVTQVRALNLREVYLDVTGRVSEERDLNERPGDAARDHLA